jgi:hypothetical protein
MEGVPELNDGSMADYIQATAGEAKRTNNYKRWEII